MNLNQEQLKAAKAAGFIIEGNTVFAQDGHSAINGKLAKFAELLGKSNAEPVAEIVFTRINNVTSRVDVSNYMDLIKLPIGTKLYLRTSLPAEQDAEL